MKNNTSMIDNLVVIYSGDETKAREKDFGLKLMGQLFKSVNSVRINWSDKVEIVLIHTEELSSNSKTKLDSLNVHRIHSDKKVEPSFPISNKMLVGSKYKGHKDILFLDCDTIVHKPLKFNIDKQMLVAYDALQDVSEADYKKLYQTIGVKLPSGRFSTKPSYEYYYNNALDLFPLINSGVFFIKNNIKDEFYSRYISNFFKTYQLFRDKMTFYFDQICFALTMHELGIDYHFFPKGYNFICTQRAPYLKDWPLDNIYIEHYAGNNGRPLVFGNNKLDLPASGIDAHI